MSTDYNASLIAELYSTKDSKKATDICDEMVEIGDSIFPRQIYEAYKKFRADSRSHYFVASLTCFKTSDTTEILKEIAHSTTSDADISMMLNYLTDINYFDSYIVSKVKDFFVKDIESEDIHEYAIDAYFNYIQKSGHDLQEIEKLLRNCFENNNFSNPVRKAALKIILKIKPKEYIAYYYHNYESIRNKKAEVIFVDEISTWHGGLIPLLHKKISEIGSPAAKEILQKEQLKKEKETQLKEASEQKVIKLEYETSDVIGNIADLRAQINKTASLDQRFGFNFFGLSEDIYKQVKPARDKESLVGYCIDLRELLGNFDAKLLEIKFSKERVSQLLPNIKEPEKSINKFNLILSDRGIIDNTKIFGLRSINQIISKLAHPREEKKEEFTDLLKQEGLFEIYKQDNWSMLHREILIRYKIALEKLLGAITIANTPCPPQTS